jgi:hypothetical protein
MAAEDFPPPRPYRAPRASATKPRSRREVTLLRGERDRDAETSWKCRPEKPEERADAIQALHDQLLFLRQLNRWVPTFHARLVAHTRS